MISLKPKREADYPSFDELQLRSADNALFLMKINYLRSDNASVGNKIMAAGQRGIREKRK